MITQRKINLLSFFLALVILMVAKQGRAQPLLVLSDAFKATDGLPYVLVRTGGPFEPIELHRDAWKPSSERPAKFPADSTGWLYLKIQNSGSFDRSLKLHFCNVMLTKARLYTVLDRQIDSSLSTGYDVPVRQRATLDRDMSLPLTVPRGRTVEAYLSVSRRAASNAVMLDISDDAFKYGTEWETLALAVTIGFCLLMWLTSLVLALYRSTKEHLYYLIYTTGGALYLIAAHGFGSLYLWPNAPWFQETAPAACVTVGITGFTLLSRHVLQIRSFSRGIDAFLNYTILSGMALILYGWAMSLNFVPTRGYMLVGFVAGLNTAVLMTLILAIAIQQAFAKRQRSYWWFAGIFANLYLLSLGVLASEAGLLAIEHRGMTSATILAVPLELFLTQIFIVTRITDMLKARQQRELELQREKEALASEKSEQQRLYGNMVHEIIKGEVESVLAEVKEDGPVRAQLKELVDTCKLGQIVIQQDGGNLFSLMKELEFIFSNRLHSETSERYFYSEIDPLLTAVSLSPRQLYELTFFLHECLNNIRKYSRYHYASLKIHRNSDTPHAITLEVSDDGIGLQGALGIADDQIEIRQDNWAIFYETHLLPRRRTGIKALFDKAEHLPGELHIHSIREKGTTIRLCFSPNSGYSAIK